jgi:hypothetical protein
LWAHRRGLGALAELEVSCRALHTYV